MEITQSSEKLHWVFGKAIEPPQILTGLVSKVVLQLQHALETPETTC